MNAFPQSDAHPREDYAGFKEQGIGFIERYKQGLVFLQSDSCPGDALLPRNAFLRKINLNIMERTLLSI